MEHGGAGCRDFRVGAGVLTEKTKSAGVKTGLIIIPNRDAS